MSLSISNSRSRLLFRLEFLSEFLKNFIVLCSEKMSSVYSLFLHLTNFIELFGIISIAYTVELVNMELFGRPKIVP